MNCMLTTFTFVTRADGTSPFRGGKEIAPKPPLKGEVSRSDGGVGVPCNMASEEVFCFCVYLKSTASVITSYAGTSTETELPLSFRAFAFVSFMLTTLAFAMSFIKSSVAVEPLPFAS